MFIHKNVTNAICTRTLLIFRMCLWWWFQWWLTPTQRKQLQNTNILWFRRTTKLCSSKNGHSKNRNSFSQWHSEFRSIILLFAISVKSVTKKNPTLFLRQFSQWRRICLPLNRNSHSSNRIIGFPTKTNSEFVHLTLFGKCAKEETLWQPKRTHWDSLFR